MTYPLAIHLGFVDTNSFNGRTLYMIQMDPEISATALRTCARKLRPPAKIKETQTTHEKRDMIGIMITHRIGD